MLSENQREAGAAEVSSEGMEEDTTKERLWLEVDRLWWLVQCMASGGGNGQMCWCGTVVYPHCPFSPGWSAAPKWTPLRSEEAAAAEEEVETRDAEEMAECAEWRTPKRPVQVTRKLSEQQWLSGPSFWHIGSDSGSGRGEESCDESEDAEGAARRRSGKTVDRSQRKKGAKQKEATRKARRLEAEIG